MRCTTFLFLILTAVSCSNSETRSDQQTTRSDRTLDFVSTVTFLNENEEEISEIEVAVADDNESRSQGLMDVEELPQDAGMLFIFDEERERNFWMASTPLSLDIIFVNADFEIVRIQRNTSPYSQDSIPSRAPAKYVVEVNAGYTLGHDIYEGAKIQIVENE